MTGVDPAEHYRLAYVVVEKFLRRRKRFVHLKEDLIGLAMESIVRDAPKVDLKRGSPSTYLVRCAELRLHTQLREQYGLVRIPRNSGIQDSYFFGCSIDQPVSEYWVNSDMRVDTVADNSMVPADEKIELDETKKAVAEAIKKLDPRSRYIVKAHSGFGGKPRTLQEISDLLGLSKERVRQIELKAMNKLRKILS